MRQAENYDADVLVIGAGVAGLSAARALAQTGLRVLLLEAQGRIGGRILTERIGNEVIELGAEFVHGRPPELLALIEEAGLKLVERIGTRIHFRDGALSEDAGDDADQGDEPFSLLEELEDSDGPDLSFAEFLDQKNISAEARQEVIGYVEGFNAADHKIISSAALGLQQKAEDAIDGDRMFHIAGGYDQIPAFLAAQFEKHGGELRLDTHVHSIEWHKHHVVAFTSQGSYAAPRVVIALPLGVLQRGSLKFTPLLPEKIKNIFSDTGPIRMGRALRFTLVFRERFWKDLPPKPLLGELSFLLSPETVPPVWWTPHPEDSNSLTAWFGGPRASAYEGMSSENLADLACKALAEIFDVDATQITGLLIGCYAHNWSSDPHSYGAYSYIAKDGLYAPALLAEPIAETLFFAGEHTTTDGHWGTVHAALSSGLRVAGQVRSCTPLMASNR